MSLNRQKYPKCPYCNKMNEHIRTSDDIIVVKRCMHCSEVFEVRIEVTKTYTSKEV